jgi:hypothetical protein
LELGTTKLANWDTTIALFTDDYQVPLLPPEIVAHMATTVELSTPVLLVLGLLTRPVAAVLLGSGRHAARPALPRAWHPVDRLPAAGVGRQLARCGQLVENRERRLWRHLPGDGGKWRLPTPALTSIIQGSRPASRICSRNPRTPKNVSRNRYPYIPTVPAVRSFPGTGRIPGHCASSLSSGDPYGHGDFL